jgi:hypothetical protein
MKLLPSGVLLAPSLLLFGSLPCSGQDLTAPGKDPTTLQTQVKSISGLIQKLQECVDQPSSDFRRTICRKALEQRKSLRDILQERLDLMSLTDLPNLLPENLKHDIESYLVELNRRYDALTAPVADPVPANLAENLNISSTPPPNEPAPRADPQAGGNASNTANQPQPYCGENPQQTGRCGGQLLRSIVGFEQAGASASNSTQKFFFDLYVSRPIHLSWKSRSSSAEQDIGKGNDIDLGPRWRSWGNLRITSVPQQINSSVATFAATFAQTVGELKVNEVAQSFEFLGGVDFRLFQSRGLFASFDRKTSQRFSLNLVAGGGVITPLTPLDSVQIFRAPTNQPNFFQVFPQATGKQFVAFTLPDRNRFFRQAYGGIRIMTNFIEDKTTGKENAKIRFPATFDITYGFNESITGGRIRGGVVRLEGFVPLPYSNASWVYLFGTGMFKPGAHAIVRTPFLLDAAPAGTLPTDPNAVVITTPQADRDYYRVGVGIDLIDLIASWRRGNTKSQTPATGSSSPKTSNP